MGAIDMTHDVSVIASMVGQVVRLKGGGPTMTVASEEKTGLLLCRWFAENTLLEHLFRPDVLDTVMH